jgi:predicted transcriptional regulator
LIILTRPGSRNGRPAYKTQTMKLQTKIELIKAGISQREIAKEAGVSNTSVSCYLTGSVDLSERMQGRIEAAITKLLNRENQPLKQQTT